MTEDRASIYAAMAEIEDDEQEERNARNPFLQKSMSGKTLMIPLADGKSIEVASPSYVADLEKLIRTQAKTIEKIERQLHRIDAKLRTQRARSFTALTPSCALSARISMVRTPASMTRIANSTKRLIGATNEQRHHQRLCRKQARQALLSA